MKKIISIVLCVFVMFLGLNVVSAKTLTVNEVVNKLNEYYNAYKVVSYSEFLEILNSEDDSEIVQFYNTESLYNKLHSGITASLEDNKIKLKYSGSYISFYEIDVNGSVLKLTLKGSDLANVENGISDDLAIASLTLAHIYQSVYELNGLEMDENAVNLEDNMTMEGQNAVFTIDINNLIPTKDGNNTEGNTPTTSPQTGFYDTTIISLMALVGGIVLIKGINKKTRFSKI